jgi:hypothetical protein
VIEVEKALGDGDKRGKVIPLSKREQSALLESLSQAASKIRSDVSRETVVAFDSSGVGFYAKRQEGNVVDVESDVRKERHRFVGATMTHNHPQSTSFSVMDIECACWADFQRFVS